MFAFKLGGYLKRWYRAEVTIATTSEQALVDLGADPKYVIGLVGGKLTQCRRFANLNFNKQIQKQDLIFVAPFIQTLMMLRKLFRTRIYGTRSHFLSTMTELIKTSPLTPV